MKIHNLQVNLSNAVPRLFLYFICIHNINLGVYLFFVIILTGYVSARLRSSTSEIYFKTGDYFTNYLINNNSHKCLTIFPFSTR